MEQNDINPVETSSSFVPVRRSPLKLALIAIGIVLVAGVVYYFTHRTQDPSVGAKKEAQSIIAAVGKLIALPTGEEPIIATVADPSKLQGQPFFQNAKKGDKVLIYNIAKKAILFDPVQNLIVDVAPLSGGQSPSVSPKK